MPFNQAKRLTIALGLLVALVWGGQVFAARQVNPALATDSDGPPGAADAYLPLVVRVGAPDTPIVPDGLPSWSAPIAVSPVDGSVWVVNPDAGSVTVLNDAGLEKVAEIAVETEPWALAIAPNGRNVYVLDRADGTVVVVDAVALRVRAVVPVGPEPVGIALSPTGARAYVTVSSASEVVVMDTDTLSIVARIPVAPNPYDIAVTDDGDAQDDDEQIYVTHFLARLRPDGVEATDDGREGHITVLDTRTHTLTDTITLAPDEHGFPNLLSSIAIAQGRAWVPQVRTAPDLPRTLTTTVFAAVSTLDLAVSAELEAARLNLNDLEVFGSPVNNPVAAVPAADGKTLYVVLAGSDLVEVIDISVPEQPRLVKFLRVGHNPRGIALSLNGRRAYVMNYLSQSVTVLDLEALEVVTETATSSLTLDPTLLLGKLLFNNASDPRLSRGSWVSCASCHPDGGTDGVTWMFPDGPRQTPPLWNATETLPWHWSAALDEPHDVEETVQLIQHGLGLAPGVDPPQLGPLNEGRSAALDALVAFMEGGVRLPVPPPPDSDALAGRDLFEAQGCAACHGGPTWTTSRLPGQPGTLDTDANGMVDAALRDVGTLNPLDVRGAEGFDPPSLLLVGLTPPYLHDGSMPTLERLLASGHPNPQGGNSFDAERIRLLAAFLRTIGPETNPVAIP